VEVVAIGGRESMEIELSKSVGTPSRVRSGLGMVAEEGSGRSGPNRGDPGWRQGGQAGTWERSIRGVVRILLAGNDISD